METVRTSERICPLCGKTIYYKVIEDDGMDWEGHHRGHESSRTEGYECDCQGKNLKKMCINCKHYINVNNTCECKELMNEIQIKLDPYLPFIEIPKMVRAHLKILTNHCNHWKINPEIATQIFK